MRALGGARSIDWSEVEHGEKYGTDRLECEPKVSFRLVYMDKLCGSDQIPLDGDVKPGVALQLTSSSKYKPNLNCKVGFRTAQPSQRLIITVEKMDIADCPGDTLVIYDGATLLNKDQKQQCGSPASFSFTVANLTDRSLATLMHRLFRVPRIKSV